MKTPTAPDLSSWQATALRHYAKDFDRATRPSFGRLEAVDELKAARAALSASEGAIADLVAGRGRSVRDLAAQSGRKVADLSAMLSAAASKLARHYEAQAAGPTTSPEE